MELYASVGEAHSSNKDHNKYYERNTQGFIIEKILFDVIVREAAEMVLTENAFQAQGKASAKGLKSGNASSGENYQRRKAVLEFCEQWGENYEIRMEW